MNEKTTKIASLIGVGLLIAFAWVSKGCSKDVQRNKLYIVSPSTAELHVLNAGSLFSVLARPLSFSGTGTPREIDFHPLHHQLLITLEGSNRLVRIGTEPPFSYTPLTATSYGSGDPLVIALGNPALGTTVVLSTSALYVINEFGASVIASSSPTNSTSFTPTPTATVSSSATPTPSPTATATATPAPTSTPSVLGINGSISLPSGCSANGMAIDRVEVPKKDVETESSPTETSDDSSTDSEDSESSSSTSFEVVSSGEDMRYLGGLHAAVTCPGLDQVVFFTLDPLALSTTVSLTSGATPFRVGFLRTPDETGEDVTGVFVVWNTNGTIELFDSSTFTRVSGSPFSVTSGTPGITATVFEPVRGYIVTGFGTASGSFVEVRDHNGSLISGTSFTLPSDCGSEGPAGLVADALSLELEDEQIDAGFAEEDLLIFYTCTGPSLVGTLSTNTGTTFLSRELGVGTGPGVMFRNPNRGILYVMMQGTSVPAPGIWALNMSNLADGFSPVSAITFASGGAPARMLVVP